MMKSGITIDLIKEKIVDGYATVNERLSECFKRAHLIKCGGWLMQGCACHLAETYQSKGFRVQKIALEENGLEGVLVQIENADGEWKKDALKTLGGQKLAVNVKFSVQGDDLIVSVDNGKWLDKTFSGFVSWTLFAPLVLLPILGAVRQRNLIADVDLEVLAFLEKKEHQNVIDID